jgi:O-antigen/teichoic acid export membrane protein
MKNLNNTKFIVLMDQALFSGTSFLITILIARMLDMEIFGLYSGYLLGIYLAIMGIGAFVIQPFQVLVGQIKKQKQYATFAFWLQLAGIVVIMMGVIVANSIIQLNLPISVLPFAAGFLLHDFGRRVFLAINQPKSTLLLDIVSTLGLLGGLYFFFLSGQKDLNILFAYLTPAYLLSTLLLLWFIKPIYFEKELFFSSLRMHVKEGKWLFLTAITQWWSGNLFVVASGIYLGAAALGALRLAQSLVGVLNVLLQAFENYILPQTAAKININLNEGLSYLTNISRKAGVLFLPVLILIIFFSKEILVLAGGKGYDAYAFVLQGMAFLYVLVFISQPIRLLVRAMMLNQHFFYGYLLSLAFALTFSHYLLSNHGLMGALMGLAVSQLLLMIYWSFILQIKKIQLWKSFISF